MSIQFRKRQQELHPTELSPEGASFPIYEKNVSAKQNLKSILLYVIGSRYLAKRVMLFYTLAQSSLITFLLYRSFNLHMNYLTLATNSTNFIGFLKYCLPGTLLIPSLIGLLIWPAFLLFGLSRHRNSRQIDTIVPHIEWIKHQQLKLINKIHDDDFNQRINTLTKVLGKKVPNDVKMLIVETCRNDLQYEKDKVIGPLTWKPKYQLNPTITWERVVSLWALFTGIGSQYGIPTDYKFKFRGFTLMVFSRDGFLVCLSCILRYNLILWVTKQTQ
jgi:hypothetical protein